MHALFRRGGLLAGLLTGLWLLAGLAPALAQTGAGAVEEAAGATSAEMERLAAGQLTRAEIRQLMSRLSDDQVRVILLEQLDKAAAAPLAEISLVDEIETTGARLRARLAAVLAAAPAAPRVLALVPERLAAAGGVLPALAALAVLLGGAFAARWLWHRRIVRRHRERTATRAAARPADASVSMFGDAAVSLVLELSGVAIFYLAAGVLLFSFWYDDESLRAFLSTYVTAVAVTLAVMAFTEFYLPRNNPACRLLALPDAATERVRAFMLTLALIWTFGFFTCRLLREYGAEGPPQTFLVLLVATLFIVVLIAMVTALRGDIAALIRGDAEGAGGWAQARVLLAASWHVLAGAYVLLLWALSVGHALLRDSAGRAGAIGPGLLGLVLIIAVPAIDRIVGAYLAARLGADSPIGAAIRRTLRVLLVVGAAALFLDLWGFDLARLEAIGIGGWLVGAVIDVGVVALVGYAVWQLARAYFDSVLAREASASPAGEAAAQSDGEGGSGATRAATLLPLARTFTLATIVVMATLTALSDLGVDIGPLLAGAGVVGLAIGFGAQTLVRDVVSGFFFLLDDAFRMGEYIDVGVAKGRVEKISVRSLRLRHHRGALNTVPFGEIQTLTNFSRDWVIMKLPLRLTYDTDPQQVKKIIKRIGAEMMADETLAAGLLEPPKSQGVLQMEDSAMILRVKFMAKPGEQFVLRRELLHRIRAAFEQEGIEFASREVTVRVAGEHDEETIEKAGAAAARALVDQQAAKRQP